MRSETIPSEHTDSVLCCTRHPTRRLLLSGDEAGALCFTDLTSRSPVGRLRAGDGSEAVPCVACSPGDDHTVLAGAGAALLRLDLRKDLGEAAVVDTYRVNADEVNAVAIDAGGAWAAAADDAGEAAVVSLTGGGGPKPAFKTLRRGHSNICAAAAFRPGRPAELLTGGLDCRVVRWDFTRLRQLAAFDMNGEAAASNGQFCNPPMVNCLATVVAHPTLVAAARGDGCVALYDVDYRPPAPGKGKAKGQEEGPAPGPLVWASGPHSGGHTAAANCVAFAGGGGRLYSVGNDRKMCVWNWQEAAEPAAQLAHRAKINWVCAGGGGGGGEPDAVLADVAGRLVAVYAV